MKRMFLLLVFVIRKQQIYVDAEGLYDLRWPLYYTAARCMWNEDLTGEQVLYDACLKLYGEAADDMFLYYRHLADAAVEEGCTQSSIVWVPPTLFEVYGSRYTLIQEPVTAACAKIEGLTLPQQARIRNQTDFWKAAYLQLAF